MAVQNSDRSTGQHRVELVIRVLEPFLDALLFVADRVSRLVERDDPDYVTPRMARDGESAPRGLRPQSANHGPSGPTL